MFTEIDYPNWDRKEIFETFNGYLYCVTCEIDITGFLGKLRDRGLKFYPAACYCITRLVNENREYRYGKQNGRVGFWDRLDAHYTLLRRDTDHLFTHKVTAYDEEFPVFYNRFLQDKEKGEKTDRLYYERPSPLDVVHISITPGLRFQALSYSKPASFTNYLKENTSYVPFITMGKYLETGEGATMPVTVEFHHAVNDGYHAQRFFILLQEAFSSFDGKPD